MSRTGCFILGGGLLAVAILSLLFYIAIPSRRAPANPRPPALAGQRVPAQLYEIPFDQKYDLYCSFFREEVKEFRDCKILGFTGRDEEPAGSGSLIFSSPSGSGSYSERYFDHWLVLELSDGRRAYIPLNAVRYIEQAAKRDR
jgi:hypothetical protein